MTGYLFEDENIPQGFQFPEAFVSMMSQAEIPHYEPWWFLTKFPDDAREWLHMLREDFPNRSLIPFAKYDVYPEVACFDGTDLSGDPAVLFADLEAPSGHQVGGHLANFAAWLEMAKAEAADWSAQRSGDAPPPPMPNPGEVEIAPPAVPKT